QLGLTNNNNRIRFDDEYSTDLYSKNSSTDKEARLTLGSYGDGEIGLGINHPTTGLQRRLVISGATSSTPNNTFLFDKGLAYY
ncbi:hypothetical protein LMP50_14010, partial [Staphylococcus aureus]|uniref:hypothetical protein n=1 Tax=Staphylococcus aureus TaxID=1280 RepID=UPI001E449C12